MLIWCAPMDSSVMCIQSWLHMSRIIQNSVSSHAVRRIFVPSAVLSQIVDGVIMARELEAIMRQVVQEAEQTRGVSRTVLQATASGLSLYEAMGYRTVTSFNVFISD